MTDLLRSYLFKTAAQWNACLFVEADRGSARDAGLRPFRTFALPPTRYQSKDACAPAITRTGDIVWLNRQGRMYRLPADDDKPAPSPAPLPTSKVSRVIATSGGLWVLNDRRTTVRLYEDDSLARLLTVDLDGVRPADIAAGAHGGVWALVKQGSVWHALPVDTAGHLGESVALEGLAVPVGFTILSRTRRFVALTAERHPRLRWFDVGGHLLSSVPVGTMHPCFRARQLGSDGRDRVFVGGTDGRKVGDPVYVLAYDADGNRLGEVPIEAAGTVTGLAATRDTLLVTYPDGLLRFTTSDIVAEQAEDVRCMLLTPSLFSPDREDQRRWLRIEALATLPEGSTLELSFGATDKTETRDRLDRIAADDSLPASVRVRRILDEPDLWRPATVFHGTATKPESPASYSAPLFDGAKRYLWVCASLIAAPRARLPVVSELAVRYPGRSLMEDLPAIYRRGEAEPGDFLRSLVGVLEATTQGIDDRIGSMGSLVHPATATGTWLDFVARWLGLPWDDGLSEDQKKAIVRRASDLTKSRGTRAGLEMLLEALMPGVPRRISDTTAAFGFAIVGNDACQGSTLPAMIGGRAPWNAELDAGARLGSMRLPCPGQTDDGTWRLAGRIRVDVAATGEERQAWSPWLLALLTDMVPLTARVQLHWVSAQSLRGNRLGGDLKLDSAPSPRLGTDAITGLARMPERASRLSASGPDIGTRLG